MIYKINKILQTPTIFLLLSIVTSLITLKSITAGLVATCITIILCFNKRIAPFLILILILSHFISSNSAFILKSNPSSKSYTTKGYFKLTEEARNGDLIWGEFKEKIEYGHNRLPRKTHSLPEKYRYIRIPVISYLLNKRVNHSEKLLLRSGGRIVVTPAHIFAVKDRIPYSTQDMYIITGLAHLLAMSGFHTAIFIGGLMLSLWFIPLKIRYIIIIPAILLLIPLSGFQITVIRSVSFAFIYLTAFILDLKVASKQFILFLAALIILFSPFSLFSISFLLSFMAVYGIIILSSNYSNKIYTSIITGIAATIFTVPLQLYFFGTSNILSVITTLILTPFVYFQIIFGILSLFFTDLFIPPLIAIEESLKHIMLILTKLSTPFMYISKPDTFILVSMISIALIISLTKYKYLSVLTLIIPLIPNIHKNNIAYFPMLPPSQKGYIIKTDEYSEIFFQGNRNSFVRYMVPAVAEFGIRNIDYGKIVIFDGVNLYINIKNNSLKGDVCINSIDGNCSLIYMTRSDTILDASTIKKDKTYLIYKNKVKHENIIELKDNSYMIPLK